MNNMIKCPCCGEMTIDDSDFPIVEICEVCYWQYDVVAQRNPDKIIGPNKVSLNTARENYRLYGACEQRFINQVKKKHNYR